MPELVFVTGNQEKLKVARSKLTGYTVEHADCDVTEIQSMDTREIVEHKIKEAHAKVGRPCFVWDTSFSFDALGGFPGPLIRWFFETVGDERICQTVGALGNRECSYTTVLGYFDGSDTHFFEVTKGGTVAEKPRGENGFDWDTFFIPEGESRTYAEMSYDEKHSFSVANELLNQFRKFLSD